MLISSDLRSINGHKVKYWKRLHAAEFFLVIPVLQLYLLQIEIKKRAIKTFIFQLKD